MEDIINTLLLNSFIELPGFNQTFEKKQGLFKLPRTRQAGRKELATLVRNALLARTRESLRGN